MKRINIGDFKLEVHSPAERIFKGGGSEAPTRAGGLLQHEMNILADQVDEALLGAAYANFETQHTNVCG